MPKSDRQLEREIAAALIAGDAELEGKREIGKHIRKQERAKAGELLGYTESGKAVTATNRGSPDTNDIVTFRKTKAKFPGWTKLDHMDASVLFGNAAALAREAGDHQRWKRLHGWESVHWDIGGRWTAGEVDARHPVIGSSWAGDIRA